MQAFGFTMAKLIALSLDVLFLLTNQLPAFYPAVVSGAWPAFVVE